MLALILRIVLAYAVFLLSGYSIISHIVDKMLDNETIKNRYSILLLCSRILTMTLAVLIILIYGYPTVMPGIAKDMLSLFGYLVIIVNYAHSFMTNYRKDM